MKIPFTLRDVARVVIGWDPEDKITSETAWLNGLRGLAAFLVLMAHYSWDYLTFVSEAPFGALMNDDSVMNGALPFRKGTRLWAPWRLPVLHLFISGAGGQVALFFVISGFVLTWRSLGLAQSEDFGKLYTSLGSSTFRRWSRLFLPCVVVTYIYALQQDINDNKNVLVGFWSYLGEAASWINPFKPLGDNLMSALQMHNAVVWTIPYEFSGSIYVFVVVLILGRFRFSRRFPISILLAVMALFSLKRHLFLFGAGMCLADYAGHGKLLKRDQTRPTSMWQSVLWSLFFFFGAVLLGWPQALSKTYTRPGYDWDEYFPLPPGWRDAHGVESFMWSFGAIIMIGSACHVQTIRKFFETAFLQYLGKISFMLYLIHILVGGEVGRRIQHAAYAAICSYDGEKISGMDICTINSVLHVALLTALYAINVPCVFVVASALERFVDRPITNLGKVIDDLLLRQWSSKGAVPVGALPDEERLLDSRILDEQEMEILESQELESEPYSDSELPRYEPIKP